MDDAQLDNYVRHKQEDYEKQTIWLQGIQVCAVKDQLTFVNMTLSGRHHFTDNCEEDWCTHCLNPELLVEETACTTL